MDMIPNNMSKFEKKSSRTQVAQLVPELEFLLPGHNTPVSEPALLLELENALEAIESGKAEGAPRDDLVEYDFGRFSILLRP